MAMKRIALVSAGATLLLTGMLAMPASAQEERCRSEAIKASGKATILGKGRARRLAIDNWQREVRQKYGERYMDFTKAREARFECEAASIGALGRFNQRCSVSGHPCRIAAAADDDNVGEGDDRRVFALQRLLRRSGYLERDDVDGEYGPKTRQAVRRFQRDEGLRVTGEMDDRTLERLRRRAERG
jgi:murein L,D-transpeptidase YcbB/YkuD